MRNFEKKYFFKAEYFGKFEMLYVIKKLTFCNKATPSLSPNKEEKYQMAQLLKRTRGVKLVAR